MTPAHHSAERICFFYHYVVVENMLGVNFLPLSYCSFLISDFMSGLSKVIYYGAYSSLLHDMSGI